MSRRRVVWRFGFLAVTAVAVGMELYGAFDPSDDTEPWTSLIVHYIPAPVTYAAIAVLLAWLPWHFWTNYRTSKEAPMTVIKPPDPTGDHPSEPLLTVGAIVTGVTALIDLGVAFGLQMTDARKAAIMAVVTVVAPVVVAMWGRRHVYSKATVAKLVDAARRNGR